MKGGGKQIVRQMKARTEKGGKCELGKGEKR